MRGGEKVLEALAGLFPEAPIYTLFHFPGSVSPAIECAPDPHQLPAEGAGHHAALPALPAALPRRDRGVRPLGLRPGGQLQPLRGQGGHPAAGRLPPLLLPHAHALRLGPGARLLPRPHGSGGAPALRRSSRACAPGTSPRRRAYTCSWPTPVSWRGASETYYDRPAEVVHPPVDVDFFTPGPAREKGYCLMVSALAPYKKVEEAMAACEKLGLELRVVGEGPERERLAALAGPGVAIPRQGRRRRAPRALPGGGGLPPAGGRGLRHRLGRGPRLRHPGGSRGQGRSAGHRGGRPARRPLSGLGGTVRPGGGD